MQISFLGIDIGKTSFHVSLCEGKGKREFNNNSSGFIALQNWLEKKRVLKVHACMEATGIYGEALANFLYDKEHLISVVNPMQIKSFAKSELLRTKTDKVDAQLIMRFCKTIKPGLWEPEPENIRELKSWQKRYDDLQNLIRQEENRKEAASPSTRYLIDETVFFLRKQIDAVLAKINEHIDQNPDLRAKKELLTSIPGVSDRTASRTLSFLGTTKNFDKARKVSAFLGLNPKDHQSGSSVKGKSRISKIGDSQLRKAFYMPALAAMRYNPTIRAFCERLKSRGKPGKVVAVAAMKKLVHIIYGVLKNNTPYQATWTVKIITQS
jgi:transposase